ncbi:MAG: hypothetical protein IAE94_15590 [Chthoniobacterales bacterium]|nr:hypothetical protein [Chthoniobacterales bacterium]
MNNKHVSCAIVAVFILVLVQVTLWVQGNRTKVQNQARAAQEAETAAMTALNLERTQLGTLRKQSADLIEFLRIWQPYFSGIDNPQSAEVNLSMLIKEANLVNLAQRFDPVPVKGNASIPTAQRAFLTFEDDYSRLMNWLGDLEVKMPTIRTSSVRLSKGTRANDLRMEVVLDQPLLRK